MNSRATSLCDAAKEHSAGIDVREPVARMPMFSRSRNGLPWSQDDIRCLRELAASGHTAAEIAERLDRTKIGVKSKALALRIQLASSRRRTERAPSPHA